MDKHMLQYIEMFIRMSNLKRYEIRCLFWLFEFLLVNNTRAFVDGD